MKQSFANRDFQLWQYRVSHGELLIRSPKSDNGQKNVDIIFIDTKYVEVPRYLDAVEMDDANEAELERARERLGKRLAKSRVFALASAGKRYLVVAHAVSVSENEMDIFESPFSPLSQ